MVSRAMNYTSANTFPVKVLLLPKLADSIKMWYIPPVNVAFVPTNRCNQDCSFCSFGMRDKTLEMPVEQACNIIWRLHKLGMKSLILSGGGEPLLHPGINEIIDETVNLQVKLGMATNAWFLGNIRERIKKFKWIRISMSSFTDVSKLFDTIGMFVMHNARVGWDISFVATRSPDYAKFADVVKFANYHRMTHVRLVSDLVDLEYLPPMKAYKIYLKQQGVNDKLVIYQDRATYTKGVYKCLLSLLKPMIDVKGDVYPCCGISHAMKVPYRDFPPKCNMGNNYEDIWVNQKYFNGKVCDVCYYSNYNQVLSVLQSKDVKDVEFV